MHLPAYANMHDVLFICIMLISGYVCFIAGANCFFYRGFLKSVNFVHLGLLDVKETELLEEETEITSVEYLEEKH